MANTNNKTTKKNTIKKVIKDTVGVSLVTTPKQEEFDQDNKATAQLRSYLNGMIKELMEGKIEGINKNNFSNFVTCASQHTPRALAGNINLNITEEFVQKALQHISVIIISDLAIIAKRRLKSKEG